MGYAGLLPTRPPRLPPAQLPLLPAWETNTPPEPPGHQGLAVLQGRLAERPATELTLGGTVGEQGHQQGHVVDVLQVGPHLVDAPGQLGLQGAETRVASGPLPPPSLAPLPWTSPIANPKAPGAQSYPVAVLQEAGEVAVRGLEANEVRVTLLLH